MPTPQQPLFHVCACSAGAEWRCIAKKQVAQSCTGSWRNTLGTNGILVLSGADKTDNHAEFANNSAV